VLPTSGSHVEKPLGWSSALSLGTGEGWKHTTSAAGWDKAYVTPRSLGWQTPFRQVPGLRSKEGAGRSDRNLCFNITACECVRVCEQPSPGPQS
jgi:hypothetical protein